ncbi:MAG TPA: sigma-54 dependent transcriptional regulator [Methylomirabilota bacterium]|nr:sigma-54 dependent transcriptional regulator [Methylomirabilota bacterium]
MKSRILVVDDDRLTRVALAHQLALEGHEVRDVENAISALALLAEEPWDLVLTDLRMPTMDGLTFLHRISETRPDTAVIVITGHATAQTAVEAMKRGAEDYLVKPVDFDELSVRVRKIMARRALERELRLLHRCPDTPDRYHALVGRSSAMRRVFERIEALANLDTTVLIQGETGTGKDLIARTLHQVGARGGGPLVKLSCALLSREVLESELFGHEAGAFTSALKQRRGRFELAQHGTLFLDEVDEIPLDLQVKLLQVLEERRFERVGGERTIEVDVRFICATKRDLASLVHDGRFREDLYYRINVVTLDVPPLRERREDILLLADCFLGAHAETLGRPRPELSPEVCRLLLGYRWPGNVRELQHAMECAAVLSLRPVITESDLPPTVTGSDARIGCERCLGTRESLELKPFLAEAEREAIRWALTRAGGSQSKAAQLLGIPRTTLRDRLALLFTEQPPTTP